jgi:hypothetical protein
MLQVVLLQAPGLPYQPFDAVPVHCPRKLARTNGNAYTQPICGGRGPIHGTQGRLGQFASLLKQQPDGFAAFQPFLPSQGECRLHAKK